MRVLIVDDDRALAEALSQGLTEQGFAVATAAGFAEARERIAVGTFAVIVLDIMLPGGTGIELCEWVRAEGDATPILMLTARDAVADRVRGLEAGADDYLPKPFAFQELVARVRALVRRAPAILPDVHRIADLEVDARTHEVRRAGRPIRLSAREYDLLEFFLLNTGAVVDRAAITAHVWDDNHDPMSNALEVLVRRLRSKIDDDFEPTLIHTLRGAGYRFGV